MDDKKQMLAKSLIAHMTNEMLIIELYTRSLKLQLKKNIRESIESATKDEKQHLEMLSDMFQKRIGKEVDDSKLKDIVFKTFKNISSEPSPLHILDIALGYEHREKNYLEQSRQNFAEDKELNKLFTHIIEDEEEHVMILEKERKATLGLPFDDFELDFCLRE